MVGVILIERARESNHSSAGTRRIGGKSDLYRLAGLFNLERVTMNPGKRRAEKNEMASKTAEGFGLSVRRSLVDPAVDWPAEEDEGGPDREQSGHDEAHGLRHLPDVAVGVH